jgi:hypothetical protein
MESFLLQPIDDEVPVDHDEKVLLSLGYKQEFKREFSLWSAFSVSFAVLGLLPSFASTLYYGMGSAGTAGALFLFLFFLFYIRLFFRDYEANIISVLGMIWGWIIAMTFIQCVALSLAELCSSMPTRSELSSPSLYIII